MAASCLKHVRLTQTGEQEHSKYLDVLPVKNPLSYYQDLARGIQVEFIATLSDGLNRIKDQPEDAHYLYAAISLSAYPHVSGGASG